MADLKISQLTAITTLTPATDVLPVVDVTGTTKKITTNQILGSGGTATLASATITGDLTVDTSTLKVDSANDNVIVGATSAIGGGRFSVQADLSAKQAICAKNSAAFYSATNNFIRFTNSTDATVGGITHPAVTSLGVWGVSDIQFLLTGAGTTAMTLNANGLGVGTSPAAKLDVLAAKDTTTMIVGAPLTTVGGGAFANYSELLFKNTSGSNSDACIRSYGNVWNAAGSQLAFFTSNNSAVTERLRIDNLGNVGIGVTPSAWSQGKAIETGFLGNALWGPAQGQVIVSKNAYFNAGWKYAYTGATASNYEQGSGGHLWYIAPSGTAGNAITFTQAMTLDASGNLLVGTTSAAGVRLDVQTATGNCIGRVKSNAAASTASFIIDYVETLGCTYIKKAASDVWIYGVQNDTSATPAFKINTASNVGVQLVSGATAWTTLSDETVKDIIEPISNAVAKVGSLRSVIGKFKTDDASKRRSFLIAQDVQSVLPEAVDVIGENNELGLRYTEV
ncbi:Intramolecular chaperone auto-processing domain containing protein, partial [uncultured Caudovirales phage]